MAKIKSTSRGLNTHETLFLRPHEGSNETYITTTELSGQEYHNIWIKPGIYGFVDVDGVRLANNKIWSEAVISDFLVPTTLNGISGALFRLNTASGMDGWHGVKNDGIAGFMVDRGDYNHKYIVFDELDDRFKVGELNDLKWIMATATEPITGSILYVGLSGWVNQDNNFKWLEDLSTLSITGEFDLTGTLNVSGGIDFTANLDIEGDLSVVGQSQFDGDVNVVGTVSVSGNAYKNGSPILNQAEADARYLEHIVDEIIDGEKTFNGDVIFQSHVFVNDDVDVVGTVSVSGNAYKNGSPILNQAEADARYLEHIVDEIIEGDKLFSDSISVGSELYVYGESTFTSNILVQGSITMEGYATGEDSDLPNAFVTNMKLASFSGLRTDVDAISASLTNLDLTYATDAELLALSGQVLTNENNISDLRTDVDIISDQVLTNENNISGLRTDVDAISASLTNLDLTYTTDAELLALSGQVLTNENNISGLRTDVDAISASLTNLDLTYATDAELLALSGQVLTNENNISDLRTDVDAISASLTNLDLTYATDAELLALSGQVLTNENNISGLRTDVDAISASLTNLDLTYATDAELLALSGQVLTNENNISGLRTDVDAISASLTMFPSTFIDLNDTPSSYIGSDTYVVTVSGERLVFTPQSEIVPEITNIRGQQECNIGQQIYTISYGQTISGAQPVTSLITPTSDSTIFVTAIFDVTDTNFKVILSEAPSISGYAINWVASFGSAINLDGFTEFEKTANVGVSGSSQVLDSLLAASTNACEWLVSINDGDNFRVSKVMSTWKLDGDVEYIETATPDIGNTDDAILSVEQNSSIINLLLTSTQQWDVKTKRFDI